MKTIIFVCHGNICRSPAAEWIFKYLLKRFHLEDQYIVYSRSTSLEEIGNDIYPPMKRALDRQNIPYEKHKATQITMKDYEKADYIFYMDGNNLRNLNNMLFDKDKKFHILSKFTQNLGYIEDPWYSGEYDIVVNEIYECCESILKNLRK